MAFPRGECALLVPMTTQTKNRLAVVLSAQQRRRLEAAIRSRVWRGWNLRPFLTNVTMSAVEDMERAIAASGRDALGLRRALSGD